MVFNQATSIVKRWAGSYATTLMIHTDLSDNEIADIMGMVARRGV